LLAGALFAPWFAPQDPYALGTLRLEDSSLPPVWLATPAPTAAASTYLLGTDAQGRDVLSAVFYGLRVSLLVGFAGTGLALVAGVLLGLVAGYWRGWLDAVIMRFADVQLAFPSMLIALFMMALWGAGLWKIVVAIAVVRWVVYARLVRGSVLAEREKDYVLAIRSLGAGAPRILLRHILPNLLTPVLVVSTVEFASIVMLEATLSFLGLGVPVTRPSLGMLIKFGYDDFFSGYWWVWLFPGLTLVLLVLSLNWLFDTLHTRTPGK
jgi:peptide/nickel transport system permease protein